MTGGWSWMISRIPSNPFYEAMGRRHEKEGLAVQVASVTCTLVTVRCDAPHLAFS